MKTLIFAVVLLFAADNSIAQLNKLELGIEGGPDYCEIASGSYQANPPGSFFSVGLTGQYNFTEKFSLKSGLMFAEKGTSNTSPITDSNGINQGTIRFLSPLDYLVIPVLAKGTFGGKVKFFVNGGPYFGFLLSATTTTTLHYNSGQMETSSSNQLNEFNSFDMGVSGGIGIEVPINRVSIGLELRYNQGILNIAKLGGYNGQGDQNESFDLLLDMRYKLFE